MPIGLLFITIAGGGGGGAGGQLPSQIRAKQWGKFGQSKKKKRPEKAKRLTN